MLGEHLAAMREMINGAVEAAQAAGQVDTSRPAEVMSSMLMTFMAGLATTIRSGVTSEQAHQLLDAQLDAIFG